MNAEDKSGRPARLELHGARSHRIYSLHPKPLRARLFFNT